MSLEQHPIFHHPKLVAFRRGRPQGPLLIAIGQMHGNEPAGTEAIRWAAHRLEEQLRASPDNGLHGTFAGLIGNFAAARAGLRFVHQDLNRLWRPELVEQLEKTPLEKLHEDERELVETLGMVRTLRSLCPPDCPMVLLDLHTTTAHGGSFAFASEAAGAAGLADRLQVPVIHGMLAFLEGTALSYFSSERFPPQTVALAFEAGQHLDPRSVVRAGAAIWDTLRGLSMLTGPAESGPEAPPTDRFSGPPGLPKHLRLVYRHPVGEADRFVMRPGYQNFQPVEKGELLAHDRNGPVRCPDDGYLLMPLYQKQGSDGFFVLKENERQAP
jgi:succinylglutamate desuccinylase